MKYVLLIIFLSFLLVTCGKKPGPAGEPGSPGPAGAPGTSCSTEQTNNGAIIRCTDGSFSVISNGIVGIDGKNGLDGVNCNAYSTDFGATVQCGESTVDLYNGSNGDSCKLSYGPNEVIITCGVDEAIIPIKWKRKAK